MKIVNQERISVATEETLHCPYKACLTLVKPLKNHTKIKEKKQKKLHLTGLSLLPVWGIQPLFCQR